MQIAPETTTTEVETKPVRKPRAKKASPVESEPYIPIPGQAPDVVDSETATTIDPETGQESQQEAHHATQTPEKVECTVLFAEDAPRAIVGDSATLGESRTVPTPVFTATIWPEHYVEALKVRDQNIQDAAEVVKSEEAAWMESKAITSERKKGYDAAVLNLRRVIESRPEKLPLFDQQPITNEPAAAAPDDRWRAWKLEDVEDLPGGSLAAFDAANLVTMGDLITWQGKGNRLEDLPGIGDVKAEKIAECLVRTHEIRPWDQPIVAEAVVDEGEPEEEESFDDDDFEDDSDEPDDE